MKQIISIILTAVLLIISCSCGSTYTANKYVNIEYVDSKFSYGLSNIMAFDVIDNNVIAIENDSEYAVLYDGKGEKISEYFIGSGVHMKICADNDKLYIYSLCEDRTGIITLDTKSGERKFNKISISAPISMSVIDDKIYMIYRDENIDPYLESIRFDENDNYCYLGEKAVCVDTSSFEISDIAVNNVVEQKRYDDERIIYYAYDDTGGYYFVFYNIVTNGFSEKIYNNKFQNTMSFDIIPDSENIIFSDFEGRKIISAPLSGQGACIDFMCDVVNTECNDLKYHNGSVYVLDRNSGDILRTEYKSAVKDNTEINMLSPEIYSEIPYGCGYHIKTKTLSDNEFALSILAADTDYDICLMTSEQPFSKNIRDKGAFYPLNDVLLVKEYLDSCFPYIKEAAINNDNIWMIPVAVNIPCIVYSPENCKKQDIELKDNITWQYLFDTADKIYQNSDLRDKYELNEYQAAGNILNKYNTYYAFSDNKTNYNTELFRNICTLIKHSNQNSDSLHTHIMSKSFSDDLKSYYSSYLFELITEKFNINEPYPYENLRAIPTPSLKANEKSCAECKYLCVNSNSSNLTAALDYISTYCSYMMTRNDSYMLSDNDKYTYSETALSKDLYHIYSEAQVVFELPYEVFWNDYIDYINDISDLDGFITEIERKTEVYFNE